MIKVFDQLPEFHQLYTLLTLLTPFIYKTWIVQNIIGIMSKNNVVDSKHANFFQKVVLKRQEFWVSKCHLWMKSTKKICELMTWQYGSVLIVSNWWLTWFNCGSFADSISLQLCNESVSYHICHLSKWDLASGFKVLMKVFCLIMKLRLHIIDLFIIKLPKRSRNNRFRGLD